MESVDNVNMEDFDATGWKIIPHREVEIARYIDEAVHRRLLSESLEKYDYIWKVLK